MNTTLSWLFYYSVKWMVIGIKKAKMLEDYNESWKLMLFR